MRGYALFNGDAYRPHPHHHHPLRDRSHPHRRLTGSKRKYQRDCRPNSMKGAYNHARLGWRPLGRGHIDVSIVIYNMVKAPIEYTFSSLHNVFVLLERSTRLRDRRALKPTDSRSVTGRDEENCRYHLHKLLNLSLHPGAGGSGERGTQSQTRSGRSGVF